MLIARLESPLEVENENAAVWCCWKAPMVVPAMLMLLRQKTAAALLPECRQCRHLPVEMQEPLEPLEPLERPVEMRSSQTCQESPGAAGAPWSP